jgi:hypothetical protein
MVCEECTGLLSIETSSDYNPLSLGIEVPYDSCTRCRMDGLKLLDDAQKSGKYSSIQMINRYDREYFQVR